MDSSHFSPEFLSARKAELEAQKHTLAEELSAIGRFDNESGTYVATQPNFDEGSPEDQVDNSEESETFQEREGQVSNLAKSLSEVDLALGKIATGGYGRCESTGDWISEDRLMAYPAARTCSDDHHPDQP